MQGTNDMNRDIKAWSKDTKKELVDKFDQLDIQHVARSPSPFAARDVLAAITAMRQGSINRITFKFPKHMVFVAKGVGKGVPAGFTGSTSRRAKDWFNSVMDPDVEKLADIVAGHQGDMIVKNLLIR